MIDQTLFTTLSPEYKRPEDVDFPINKIRFLMDLLWNTTTVRPLSPDQKTHLKGLIDLLNSLDDHKLSPTRELIQSITPQLGPLMTHFPSLGHSFTVIVTTIIPAYQRYLGSLENKVKEAQGFSNEEVLLYYDMTLVDHIVLSHLFEQEPTLNLIELIETIKCVVTMNALTHDFLQDHMGRSISIFTFMQRGGLAKEKSKETYLQLMQLLVSRLKENITNPSCFAYIEFMTGIYTTLANQNPPSTDASQALSSTLDQSIPQSQQPSYPQVQDASVQPVAAPVPVLPEQPLPQPLPTAVQPSSQVGEPVEQPSHQQFSVFDAGDSNGQQPS